MPVANKMSHLERESRRKEIKARLLDGDSANYLAALYGVSVSRIYSIKNGNDAAERDPETGLTEVQKRRLSNLRSDYDWSKRDTDLAKLHGCTKENIRIKRLKAGMPKVLKRPAESIEWDKTLKANRAQIRSMRMDEAYKQFGRGKSKATFTQRLYILGLRLKPIPHARSISEILSLCNVDASTGCWNWTGVFAGPGYPIRSGQLIHRKMYELANGDIPLNRLVLRTCGNIKCVNPDHLVLGDMKKAQAHRIKKGTEHE